MSDEEYVMRRDPLLKQKNEGREGYTNRTKNPYSYETELYKYVSWEKGYVDEMNDQCLIDMGR